MSIIFDQKLKDEAIHWRNYKPEWKTLTEGQLGVAQSIVARISEDYSCSTSNGFSFEEEELATLFRMVYDAGYNHAIKNVLESRVKDLRYLTR